MTKIIDGKHIAAEIESDLLNEVNALKKQNIKPGLVVILVGDDPASATYVRSKGKACERLGIKSDTIRMPASTSQDELIEKINEYNSNPEFSGILVQLPLPKHIEEETVLRTIDPNKDVDCFHPYNVGRLSIGDGHIRPCTPGGIVEMIARSTDSTSGKHAVVIGRSNIVGKPIASLLLYSNNDFGNCTVTVCHSRTPDLKAETLRADILVAAIGRPNFVTADMVKDGAIVIDVGINRVEADNEKGYKIVGDVDFDNVVEKASKITPVPGGVGKMTIAMLMKNTIECAKYLSQNAL
jgi:methylenetetrahydrofolate dehydrogenase (NADP+)/methenyltetrahydrofolate cyclohydrolase